MNFRISDTFSDSLARLTGDEQKSAKTTAFDLQLNPTGAGLSLHRVERVRDPNFWSVRVSGDLRLIVHRTDGDLLLCYVDHHDKAYDWASRRKLETHPKTGAAQLVEVRETVREIVVAKPVEQQVYTPTKPALFARMADGDLLNFGVPPEWLEAVKAADEDALLDIAARLPAEASEALLELATGGTPSPRLAAPGTDPFAHPDAQRRFRIMGDVEALRQALEYPWDKWLVFLHPAQRSGVERDYNGPARVSGSAGTGKTIVALHRAVHLARQHAEARVLLCTFSTTLANALHNRMRKLISSELKLAERLEVQAMDAVGERLHQIHVGRATLATPAQVDSALRAAAESIPAHPYSLAFLRAEWLDVVDAWQLRSWDEYRDVRRIGRKTRLTEAQRALLWQIFEQVSRALSGAGVITRSAMFHQLAQKLADGARAPYDYAVIDEAQDISIGQLRFLAAMAGHRPNGLFFAGDLGQRIFQQPFSWKALGVDIRGRARTLQVNYRTSHQIRAQADRLLDDSVSDVDGNSEQRKGTVSVFNGPTPRMAAYNDEAQEAQAVADWLRECAGEALALHEIGLFVRSQAQIPRARAAAEAAGLPYKVLDHHVDPMAGAISISTMHLAKGLEFRAVAVMACDDEVIPLQARIDAITDEADLEEVYTTERHLLYVACTRARDHLLITSVEPASEFLDDMRGD